MSSLTLRVILWPLDLAHILTWLLLSSRPCSGSGTRYWENQGGGLFGLTLPLFGSAKDMC